MLFPPFLETNNSGNKLFFFRKTIIFHIMSSSCFFMLDLFSILFGNIEKCPFTYWLNGRWFLQMVDEPVGGRSRATELPCFIRKSYTTLSHTLYCDTDINMLAVSYTFTKVCQRITSELNLYSQLDSVRRGRVHISS